MMLFWKIYDRFIEFMAALAGVILVFITAAVCYTIGMRFLFKQTTIWIIQTCEYALLWIAFLATTWLLREGGHIAVDIICAHLNDKTKNCLSFIMYVMGGLFCIMLTFLGIVHMYDCIANNVTDVRAVTIPKSVVFSIIPIGSLLLIIQFFRMAWGKFTIIRAGK